MNTDKINQLTKRIENIATKKYMCEKLLHNIEHANNELLIATTKKYGQTLHKLFDSLDFSTLNQIDLQLLDDMDKIYKNDNLLKIYDRLDLQIMTYMHKKKEKQQFDRSFIM